MLITIPSRGSGGGSGPTGYLMADKDHAGKVRDVAPLVLRGDPEQTRELIYSLDFKRKYTRFLFDGQILMHLDRMTLWELMILKSMSKPAQILHCHLHLSQVEPNNAWTMAGRIMEQQRIGILLFLKMEIPSIYPRMFSLEPFLLRCPQMVSTCSTRFF